jgi:release factor glutamine methyltransferase
LFKADLSLLILSKLIHLKLKDTIKDLKLTLREVYQEEEAGNIVSMVLEFLGYSRREIALRGNEEIDPKKIVKMDFIMRDLIHHKPVQYVFGEADFYGLKFKVNKHVLIPRHETEELVDLIIRENHLKNPRIIDIGTGSGCIAVCLGKFIPGSEVTATDISRDALKIASWNAEKNGVKIQFIKDDVFRTSISCMPCYDILVSNPPYVRESEKKHMRPNVLDYEPGLALFVPDEDPLKYYGKIAEMGMSILKNGAGIFVEINEKFGREVAEIFKDHGFSNIDIIGDIHGKDRIVKGVKPS